MRHGGPDPYRSPKSQANRAGLAAIGHPWMGRLTREMRNSAADPYPPDAGPARAPVAWSPPARPARPRRGPGQGALPRRWSRRRNISQAVTFPPARRDSGL